MRRIETIRRALFVSLAMVMSILLPGRADALYMTWQEIERPVDWRLSLSGRDFGIAEEVHVKKWFFNEHDGREVESVGTAIHFGFGAVTVPCRLLVFVTAVVGSIIGVVVLSMLTRRRRRWTLTGC